MMNFLGESLSLSLSLSHSLSPTHTCQPFSPYFIIRKLIQLEGELSEATNTLKEKTVSDERVSII